MREIKFRAWDGKYQRMHYKVCVGNLHDKDSYTAHSVWLEPGDTDYKIPELGQWMHFDEHSDYTLLQFTGLKDKNGTEIYEGDALRIKGIMGDKGEYKFDAIYKVDHIRPEGLSLSFVRLFTQEPDSLENSYPISQSPSFRYGSLAIDYVNQKYDQIAIPNTHGENAMSRTYWKEHHYTNDIEIIGNIYENHELLQTIS